MDNLVLREVEPKDLASLVDLCRMHAEFEGADYTSLGKEEKLERAFFQEPKAACCLVAELKGEIVGYSTATREFSTWDADHYLHMDCLFILENMRGVGLGGKFIAELKELAKKWNCTHLQWQTPSDNDRAVCFYLKQNATFKDKKRFYLEVET